MYVKPWIKDIVRIGGRQGRAGYLRLDMNENPGGLPVKLVEEVKKELTPKYLATYPEESRMMKLLADYLSGESGVSVTEDNLCLTNGSDLAIRYLYEVFAETGSTVVTVAPSFEMYRIYGQVFGLKHRPVTLGEDGSIPVEQVLEAIREDTDLVVLLNPNNPIGRAYTVAEFEAIADKAASVGALVIVDEAYHYFYRTTFMPQALKRDHVVVLRTFSKLMSLAGCRMGFMTASPRLIEYVRHVRPTFEVNGVALKLGEKMMEHPELIGEMQQHAQEGKDYLLDSLKTHGYDTMAEDGNFIFVRPKHGTAKETAKKLEDRMVLVKTYGAPMLADYLRVSTGEQPYMKQFLDIFYEVDGQ